MHKTWLRLGPVDRRSALHRAAAFTTDKRVILYRASGGRSPLAGKTLQAMGYKSVFDADGFKEQADAGLTIEPA